MAAGCAGAGGPSGTQTMGAPSAGGSSTATIGAVSPAPRATLNPASLSFGDVPVGSSSVPQTVTLTNTGNANLNVAQVTLPPMGSGFIVSGLSSSLTLTPSEKKSFTVEFAPLAPSSMTSSVTLASNAVNSPTVLMLSGNGTAQTAVTLSRAGLIFGAQNVGTSSGAQTVTLTNTSTAPLAISSIAVTGANAGDFSQSNTCPASLSNVAGSNSCTISVTFTPGVTGTRTASVTITDNAGFITGSQQSVALSGAGAAPAVTLSASGLTFPAQNVGTSSGAQTVTLTNSGTAPLAISSIAVTGANAGDFSQSNTCPASLSNVAGSNSCTISVTFTPGVTGTRTASVTITDNAGFITGSQQSVALSGAGAAPAVTLSASGLTFPAQNVGTSSGAQTVTLTNSGTAPLAISSIAVTGANAGDFSQSNTCPASLSNVAGSNSCTISVTFTPGVTGTRTASVTITDNAGFITGSQQSVALSGAGAAPAVTLNPISIDFGGVVVASTSPAVTVTLTNSGTAPLAISSIAVTGTNAGDFSQTNTCPASLSNVAGSNSCTISVTFKPSAAGTRRGSLSINDNAAGSPQSVSLSGTGTTGVSLSWDPPTPITGETVVGYNVSGSTSSTGPFGRLNASLVLQTNYIDSSAKSGMNCYLVTSVDSDGIESIFGGVSPNIPPNIPLCLTVP